MRKSIRNRFTVRIEGSEGSSSCSSCAQPHTHADVLFFLQAACQLYTRGVLLHLVPEAKAALDLFESRQVTGSAAVGKGHRYRAQRPSGDRCYVLMTGVDKDVSL